MGGLLKKKVFYTELSYLVGIIILAFGTVFMEKADLGMSMVVAPAYVIYRKVSEVLPFFTFGMAEYCFQAVLLIILIPVLGRFKISYLFSFFTAVLYGLILDGSFWIFSRLSFTSLSIRIVWFVIGMVLGSIGVALLFHTYIAPEVYELFVKELSETRGWKISRVKTIYDCVSCLAAVVMSFLFFGFLHFEGVKYGTVVCAIINGALIGRCSSFFERFFEFKDGFKWRKFFAG